MSDIKFFPEEGGHIDFSFDTEEYYGIAQRGTTVSLWKEELVFVKKQKCSCTDAICTAQETHFSESEIIVYPLQADVEEWDRQPYVGDDGCWVKVQLFIQDKVDAACPAGWVPAIAVIDNGQCTVEKWLW